jgi:hypothetical protein
MRFKILKSISPMNLIVLYAVGSCAGWYGVWWSSGQTFWDWANTRVIYPQIFEKELIKKLSNQKDIVHTY